MNSFLTKRNIIVLVGAVLALAAIGIFLFLSASPTQEDVIVDNERNPNEIVLAEEIPQCNALDNSANRDICMSLSIVKHAEATRDASYCTKLTTLVSVRECAYGVLLKGALQDRALSLCDRTSEEALANRCRGEFYLNLALAWGSADVCLENADVVAQKTCRDDYFFYHDFVANQKGFACTLFTSALLTADCKKYVARASNITNALCAEMKSNQFQTVCAAFAR